MSKNPRAVYSEKRKWSNKQVIDFAIYFGKICERIGESNRWYEKHEINSSFIIEEMRKYFYISFINKTKEIVSKKNWAKAILLNKDEKDELEKRFKFPNSNENQ